MRKHLSFAILVTLLLSVSLVTLASASGSPIIAESPIQSGGKVYWGVSRPDDSADVTVYPYVWGNGTWSPASYTSYVTARDVCVALELLYQYDSEQLESKSPAVIWDMPGEDAAGTQGVWYGDTSRRVPSTDGNDSLNTVENMLAYLQTNSSANVQLFGLDLESIFNASTVPAVMSAEQMRQLSWLKSAGANVGIFAGDFPSTWKTSGEILAEYGEAAADLVGDLSEDATLFESLERDIRVAFLAGERPAVGSAISNGMLDGSLTQLQGIYLYSLEALHTGWVTDNNVRQRENTGVAATPIDAATAAYALQYYMSQVLSGAVNPTDNSYYDDMGVWTYKLQATMGLASGVLLASDVVTQDDIDTFMSTAYSTRGNWSPVVGMPNSAHLGNQVYDRYYDALVVCYQEFGFYGLTLKDYLAAILTESVYTYHSYASDIQALGELYKGVSWADDEALWEFWNRSGGIASLGEIYAHLLSVSAFEAFAAYDPDKEGGAFRYFFAYHADSGEVASSFQLSEYIQTGLRASATFLPLRTNVYDPYTWIDMVDNAWLLNFHTKFGYYRKALYIDTNVDAALAYQRTGKQGDLRVCTLEDLLNTAADVVLYLDDNLYNVNQIAELTDKAYDRVSNSSDGAVTAQGLWNTFKEAVTGLWDVSMENVAKTAEVEVYSQRVYRSIQNSDTLWGNDKWSSYFFDSTLIDAYLSPDDLWDVVAGQPYVNSENVASTYSPLAAFAALSAVYMDESGLLPVLNDALACPAPVFVASAASPYAEGATDWDRNQIYNYLLLENLESQITLDYATSLDLTSPVYMDVYGNIVTESGLVVVPAAANATLWTSDWTPYNAAFYTTYGDSFYLECDSAATELNNTLSRVMTPVEHEWQLTSVTLNGTTIDLTRLSTADRDTLNQVSEVFLYDVSTGKLARKAVWTVLITEVLRGAPLECIDKDFEDLNLRHTSTITGLKLALKLESLVDALSGDKINSTLLVPNPAYMDGVEYIVFFAYKILILAILVVWMVSIYTDAVSGELGLRTGGKCIGAVLLVISLIVGIPAMFELSYYGSNKALLQEETEYLLMLNLEKQESGREIGITSVAEPDDNTTLYLKLADVDIPWYDLFSEMVFSSTVNTLEELYAEYEGNHPLAFADNVTVINDGIYVSTDQLFESSTVAFSTTSRTLYQRTTEDTPASYYTPYYYFLDSIIYKVNQYAIDNHQYAYTAKTQRGGKLKTFGYIENYFTSAYFMEEGMDYFGLYTLYEVTSPMQYMDEKPYGEATLTATRASQWCNQNASDEARIERIELLNEFAREWVAEHRGVIGKVSDETFLKCFALACAMEHNRLFNTLRADCLEIYSISNEDLLRLSIADSTEVMNGATLSFARFVYSVGGTTSVYAAALLTIINFLSSWIKPLVTVIVFILTCVSIFVFKLILRQDNKSVFGYACTILLMCGVNLLGSVFLKLSMFLPGLGLHPTVCILLQIVVQTAYMGVLLWVVWVAARDWRNLGFTHFESGFNKLTHHHAHSVDTRTPRQSDGWAYYNLLKERWRRRNRSL